MKEKNPYDMMGAGVPLDMTNPVFKQVADDMNETYHLTAEYNKMVPDHEPLNKLLSKIVGYEVDSSSMIRPPFYINAGKCLKIGKNVFVNQNCTMIAGADIVLEDGVMIGPMATILGVNHDLKNKNVVICKKVLIKKCAWIGARAIILPGVTIGENAVVAAGAIVTKDVEANTVVAGVPAKFVKKIE
jgi:acetyltransferase-like isoleucine patch superfamily enzyme